MSNRREFIKQSAFAGSSLLLARAGAGEAPESVNGGSSKPLRMLFLGGTGYIGSHFVQAALARRHQVAVFSRGKKGTEFPAAVEQLVGDRGGDLKSIENRDWDAVFDLATYVPKWVRFLGKALQGRVRHYTFISSIIAYQYPGATDEQSKLQSYTGGGDPYSMSTPKGSMSTQKGIMDAYGTFKVLCEQEAERQFSGKTVVLRPGTIVGPGEKLGSLTYWIARMERGGEILAAGDPLSQVQFIDVRDLADWAIRLAEGGKIGAYTAVGPAMPLSWSEMLGGIRAIYSAPMSLTWIPSDWLMERKIEPASSLLFWPTQVGLPGSTELNNDKASANGLTFRSLHTTATDTLAWYKHLPPEHQRTALLGFDQKHKSLNESMAREAELLSAWRQRKA